MTYPDVIKHRAIELGKAGYNTASSIEKALMKEFPADYPHQRTISGWLKQARENPANQTQVAPYTDDIRKHQEMIMAIATCILEGGLDLVVDDGTAFYKIGPKNRGEIFFEDFPEMLGHNIEVASKRYGQYEVNTCFLTHLRAEFPKSISKLPYDDLLWDKSYEILEVVRALAKGRPYQGKCDLCKDW